MLRRPFVILVPLSHWYLCILQSNQMLNFPPNVCFTWTSPAACQMVMLEVAFSNDHGKVSFFHTFIYLFIYAFIYLVNPWNLILLVTICYEEQDFS